MFAVTGKNSTIVQRLEQLTGEEGTRIAAGLYPMIWGHTIPACERYVLAAGVLLGLPIAEIPLQKAFEVFAVNTWSVLTICEQVLDHNHRARICVIGTESVPNGSYDRLYAATKAGVHQYVLTRKVLPTQQLICVSPTIIEDSGMTQRRPDLEYVLAQRRTVRAIDVARVIHRVMWDPLNQGGTNVVIPVTIRHPYP